jgi:glycosyltransferase involved in cell wall biosynthesis
LALSSTSRRRCERASRIARREETALLTISAVVPAYNRGRFIGDAIASVLGQSRRPDEIIVVDDASQDDTAAIAAAYPGVTLIRLSTNAGAAGARNAGLAAARGDVVAWLDSDDIWLPRHCEVNAELLERHPDAILAFSAISIVGGRARTWMATSASPGVPFDAMLVTFEETTPVTMSAALIRRDALTAAGGLDGTLRCSVDFDLYLRLAALGPFVCSHEPTVEYRLHGDQISWNQHRQVEAMYRIRLQAIERARQRETPELAAHLQRKLAQIWARDVHLAWWKRDMARLRLLRTFAGRLPGDVAGRGAFRYRQYLPAAALRLWDGLQRRSHDS